MLETKLLVRPFVIPKDCYLDYHDVVDKFEGSPVAAQLMLRFRREGDTKETIERRVERLKTTLKFLGLPITFVCPHNKKDDAYYECGVPISDVHDYLDRLLGCAPYPMPSSLPFAEQKEVYKQVGYILGGNMKWDAFFTGNWREKARVVGPEIIDMFGGPRNMTAESFREIGIRNPCFIGGFMNAVYPWLKFSTAYEDDNVTWKRENPSLGSLVQTYLRNLETVDNPYVLPKFAEPKSKITNIPAPEIALAKVA